MKRHNKSGFTVVEMIVAISLSVALIAALSSMFLAQRKALWRVQVVNEMHQGLRMVADMIARDVQLAGYGIPASAGNVSDWVTWVPGVGDTVVVSPGATATATDSLTVVGALDEAVSTLAGATSVGTTTITVPNADAGEFNTTTRKLLYIGRLELARIVAKAGAILTISTSPTAGSAGLAYAYPAGTPIELVEVVTYSCQTNNVGFPFRPYLMRDDHSGVLSNAYEKMVAVGIDDFQAAMTNGVVSISLRSRSRETDTDHTDPGTGDHYWRQTVTVSASPRN